MLKVEKKWHTIADVHYIQKNYLYLSIQELASRTSLSLNNVDKIIYTILKKEANRKQTITEFIAEEKTIIKLTETARIQKQNSIAKTTSKKVNWVEYLKTI